MDKKEFARRLVQHQMKNRTDFKPFTSKKKQGAVVWFEYDWNERYRVRREDETLYMGYDLDRAIDIWLSL